MPQIHAIRTGLVRVRRPQMESRGAGVARLAHMLFADEWSGWLPIYAWVIEHAEGLIVVDTGESSRVHDHTYHPTWHPFFRRAVRFSVHPDEEIGPQLRARGFSPRDVRHVVLTHLHTDHVGGLAHLTGSTIWVSEQEWRRAQGAGGKIRGYLPHRWPKWCPPHFVRFHEDPVGPFSQSLPLTEDGQVVLLPTPGHTPHHLSVLVNGSPSYLLAGDTSYTQRLLVAGIVDGVSPNPAVSRRTASRIMALANHQPLVYLPSHDPDSEHRLLRQSVLEPGAEGRIAVA